MKLQIVFLVLCFVAVTFATFQCKNGVPYKENGCNTCTCANERLSCGRKQCTEEKPKELRDCQVGSEWKYKCNDCWCDKDDKTICTNYPC